MAQIILQSQDGIISKLRRSLNTMFAELYTSSGTAETIKAHVTDEITSPTVGSWTDFTAFSIIANETIGGAISLNADTKTFNVNQTGLYAFGGCVHFENDSGGERQPLVASRIFLNGDEEARCSQRAWNGTIKNGGENVLSYNGTVYVEAGDTLTLQYYVNDSTIDFRSNAVFANPVACTLWLTKIGTN